MGRYNPEPNIRSPCRLAPLYLPHWLSHTFYETCPLTFLVLLSQEAFIYKEASDLINFVPLSFLQIVIHMSTPDNYYKICSPAGIFVLILA